MRLRWFLAGIFTLAIALAAGGWIFLRSMAGGFSARAQPSGFEVFVARTVRSMAMPADARDKPNPVPDSPEAIAEGRAHWADHCAACHANDGSGQIPMREQMYPPAPDMRKQGTQKMTDGELFYIIENGVRLTGMPAWGGTAHGQEDSWKLVRFIRHLPSLTQAEIRKMESLNPKSPEDIEEEKQEEEFLKGGPVSEERAEHHHHHN